MSLGISQIVVKCIECISLNICGRLTSLWPYRKNKIPVTLKDFQCIGAGVKCWQVQLRRAAPWFIVASRQICEAGGNRSTPAASDAVGSVPRERPRILQLAPNELICDWRWPGKGWLLTPLNFRTLFAATSHGSINYTL